MATSAANDDKLQEVKQQVDDVVDIMHDNLKSVSLELHTLFTLQISFLRMESSLARVWVVAGVSRQPTTSQTMLPFTLGSRPIHWLKLESVRGIPRPVTA